MKATRWARGLLLGVALALIAAAASPAAWAQQPSTYRVLPGDTLPTVAIRFGVPLEALLRAHGLALNETLYAGDTLVLPLAPAAEQHRVAPGETIQTIAARYDVAAAQIAWRNGLADPQRLTAGQLLVIPDVTGQVTATETALVWPVAGQRVGAELQVSGWGQSDDNELVVRVQSADGAIVARGSAAVHAEIGQLGSFGTRVSLPTDLAKGQMLLVTVLRRDLGTGELALAASVPVTAN